MHGSCSCFPSRITRFFESRYISSLASLLGLRYEPSKRLARLQNARECLRNLVDFAVLLGLDAGAHEVAPVTPSPHAAKHWLAAYPHSVLVHPLNLFRHLYSQREIEQFNIDNEHAKSLLKARI
jgi:hypothetical protein